MKDLVKNALIVILASVCLLLYLNFGPKTEMVYNELLAERATNDSLTTSNIVYERTVMMLEVHRDSLENEILEVSDSLRISRKRLRMASNLKSETVIRDTLKLNDTIFREDLRIDTTLSRLPHYEIELSLAYPDSVIVAPRVVSDKYIIAHVHKEYVKPRKKFFLFRWFQKKRKVLKVEVVEKNPYITEVQNKFIQFIDE